MNLDTLLKQKGPVVTDGAMGTYFTQKTGLPLSECERSNLSRPELILDIHREYVAAGAQFLRTNTFSANTKSLSEPLERVLEIVRAGYRLAKEAAGGRALAVADMTSIYPQEDEDTDLMPEYLAIADAFLSEGADTFLFETLTELAPFDRIAGYLKEKKPDCRVLVSFTVSPEGITRIGVPLYRLLEELKPRKNLFDAVGLNCGCGPTHMLKFARELLRDSREYLNLPVLVLPNAGYPAMEESRMVFDTSPAYFSHQAARIAALGVNLIGGCCGTTPAHIGLLRRLVQEESEPVVTASTAVKEAAPAEKSSPKESRFARKLRAGEFVMAAELDPPYGSGVDRLVEASRRLRDSGVDIVTISDSPMARVKLDPMVCGAKLQRETRVEVLPHFCCRDRNVNALRAMLLGAQCENIHAVLAVTGDQVPEQDRGYIKPVFNVTSSKLMEIISHMNRDLFSETPFLIGGAFNPNVANPKAELNRLEKKLKAGAEFFLTQPVFDESRMEVVEKARSLGAKMLLGVMPLVSYRNAVYMNNEVPGIQIPKAYVDRFSPEMSREAAQEAGIEIALEIAGRIKPYADGFYFMTPFNRAEIVAELMEKCRTM